MDIPYQPLSERPDLAEVVESSKILITFLAGDPAMAGRALEIIQQDIRDNYDPYDIASGALALAYMVGAKQQCVKETATTLYTCLMADGSKEELDPLRRQHALSYAYEVAAHFGLGERLAYNADRARELFSENL